MAIFREFFEKTTIFNEHPVVVGFVHNLKNLHDLHKRSKHVLRKDHGVVTSRHFKRFMTKHPTDGHDEGA